MGPLESFTLCAVGASAGVYSIMVGGFLRGVCRRSPPLPLLARPSVSILKPLAGRDDELRDNLASFARLTYPDYELLFGVASVDDPAHAEAQAFLRAFPAVKARVLVTRREDAENPKVAQLLMLERVAKGAVLIVSDSNVRVEPSYVEHLVRDLSLPNVALVSSVIGGSGEQSFGAALENLQLGALVAPGVVASFVVLGKTISVGKSMAMWRHRLVSIGGFRRVAHVLGEDHMLGRAFEEAGFQTRVSFAAVDNRNVSCSVRRTVERHTRWAKLRRSIEPSAFFLEPLLSPVLVATAACLLVPARATALALFACMAVQTVGALVTTRVVRGHALGWCWAPLEVVRCYLMMLCWFSACVSRRVRWRGHDMRLGRDSAIVFDEAKPSSARDPALVRVS
jgi:ceramide glucosyltransferase